VPYNVSIILPNNLTSGYLQSEFINLGQPYSSNSYSKDPTLDDNQNTLTFSFEVRDSGTRELTYLRRIKTLYLSNDPEFESTATIAISNWPSSSYVYDPDFDYEYTLNPLHFFDNTLTQGTMATPVAGTGLFKVYNWPLSASGGLSTVYMKAILEGPNGTDIEYPMGYGIFDQIRWEGQIPVNPDFPEIPSAKSGFVGKNTLLSFASGNQVAAQTESSGIGRYVASVYEISNTGGTYDAYSARNSVKRTLIPSASIASTTLNTYRYFDGNYSSSSLSLGANIGLTSASYGKGAFFYSRTKLVPSANKTDFYSQAGFSFTTSGVAVTSQAFMKLYAAPDTSANGNEIVCRVDILNNDNPIAYLYTRINGSDSVSKQTTTLPHSVLPLLQSGGVMEMYYSSMGTTNLCMVEAYFTPYLDQSVASRKSYLLGNAILTSFGSSSVGSAFGYQISQATGTTFSGGLVVEELFLAQGKSKLSIDIGDCTNDDIAIINSPLTEIEYGWSDSVNEDFIVLTDAPSALTFATNITSELYEIDKLDSLNSYIVPLHYELQLYKPSLSNRCRFELAFKHGSDDVYVAFSSVSSFRSHTQNNLTVNWDRPFGVRCDDGFAYSDAPLHAPTILVKFSGEKNEISVSYRTEDNKLRRQVLRSYQPQTEVSKFLFEITDQLPNSYTGRYKNKTSTGTFLLVKEITGSGINVVGVTDMLLPINSNASGLGYFVGFGVRKSSYNSDGSTYFQDLKWSGIPNVYKEQFDNDSTIKTTLLSDEGLTNSKHYLGQKLLSGLTDLIDYQYETANTLPKLTIDAQQYSFTPLPNSPTYSSNRLSAGTAGTLLLNGNFITSTTDYIFVAGQATTSQNGVYYQTRVGTASTTWRLERVPQMDSSEEIYSGMVVRIPMDYDYASTKWYLTTPDPITLGTSNLSFAATQPTVEQISLATTGTNISIANITSLTIDGTSLSSLAVGSKILVKDQIENTENGVYIKSVSGFAITTTGYDVPLRVTGGSINSNTNWYKSNVTFNGNLVDRFVSTTFFKSITIGEISNFVSSTKPKLFEFKLHWDANDKSFPMEELKIRFFGNIGSLPDNSNPLTSWKSVSYNPFVAGFTNSPNNNLVQVKLDDSDWNSNISQSDVIWVAITVPLNSALGRANGIELSDVDYIQNGEFTGYRRANNLWHKLHTKYEEKAANSTQNNAIQYRVRAVSHGNISSYPTKLSSASKVDINAPSYLGDVPNILVATESTLRMVQLSIQAEDNDSGILAFRVGKEIDNSFINYTTWLPWDKFIVSSENEYYLYLYGHLNYYALGPQNTAFQNQNIGFSGQRKIWVQLMDYMGNVSESNPISFVATSQALVDTQEPFGTVNFFNPKTNQETSISNLPESWMKIDGFDLVTGIKDFQIRRLLDSGNGAWSEWIPYSPYVKVDFAGESDGVKKVEIKFRDFGNNITQPEVKWNAIRRPKV
jgi:hypothetical protein